MSRVYLLLFIIHLSVGAVGQSFNHWQRSFNEESSLLSGAVVGGGAGPSAIYYNPAAISEIKESKLSFHASLFSYTIYHIENALGEGINLNWARFQIEPRFVSYMIKPRNQPNWTFEIAILNNENYKLDIVQSVDMQTDILEGAPGPERYFGLFRYQNNFRDDWVGFGGSLKLSERLFVGASMFVTVKSMEYTYNLDIEAYPANADSGGLAIDKFYVAGYRDMEYVKYNDYRLLWKAGLLYKTTRMSIGVSITTPSVGGIYSDGKRVARTQKQTNITYPESGQPMPDYLVADYREKRDVEVNHKTPFSVAAGLSWYSPDRSKSFYTTAEYFGGLEPYRLVQADENTDIASGMMPGEVAFNEWLTFVSGARPVLNAAVGYSWVIAQDLRLLTGFRTDFNYIKNFDFEPLAEIKSLRGLFADNYHITGGLSWSILGQDLITGIQYTIARERGQQQFVNLSDPVEYNTTEMAPLQGTRNNNMNSLINAISFYLGATFNFGGTK